MRRAARYADSWLRPGRTLARYRDRVTRLRALTDRTIETGNEIAWHDAGRPVNDVVAEVNAWRAAGTDVLSIWFGPLEGNVARMAALARLCLP